MAYARIEPSGCGIHKNRGKLRLDFFLESTDPNYDKHHVYIIDTESDEFKKGYQGKMDESGSPVDLVDYEKWVNSLPHVWQNNPFHSHILRLDLSMSDSAIKTKIGEFANYFYQFHQHCWDEDKPFIEDWKKVAFRDGTVRAKFAEGKVKDISSYETRIADILARVGEFEIPLNIKGVDLNIGTEGTIDVGDAAIDRGTIGYLRQGAPFNRYYTRINIGNPANDTGTIDTVEAWFVTAADGNSVKYGMFEDLGSNEFVCNAAEEYGAVSAGSKQSCTGLSIAVSSGEYIGADARTTSVLTMEYDTAGGSGALYKIGQFCDPTDQETFSLGVAAVLSLYGTGDGAAPPSFIPKITGII